MPRLSLRFMTYNIHGCIGRFGRYDAEAIIRVIQDSEADLVALQEVYDEPTRGGSFLDRLRELPFAECLFAKTLDHPARGAYGNVLLSRWDFASSETIDLSVPGREPRGAIRGRIQLGDTGEIDVYATHFGLRSRERRQQLEAVKRRCQSGHLSNPAVARINCLLGDLNEWRPGRAVTRALGPSWDQGPRIRTFPAWRPILPLDRIVTSPEVEARRFALKNDLTRSISDHLPLIADIDIEFNSQPPIETA